MTEAGGELDRCWWSIRLYFVLMPSLVEEGAFDRDIENSQGSYSMAEEIRCTCPEGRGACPGF